MIKIMIADDQELIRQSLEIVLGTRPDFQVVDTARNSIECLNKVRAEQPDVILMDIRMPGMDGVECTGIIKNEFPAIKIILLTTFDNDEYILGALRYGASGYLLKGASMEELESAIRIVLNGGTLLNPEITSKVVRMFGEISQNGKPRQIKIDESGLKNLVENEWSIIRMIGMGKSNKEISCELNFSEGTIRNYISTILSKLNLRDRTQIAIWVVEGGMDLCQENL